MSVYKRTWKRPDGSKGACWYFHRTINGLRYRDRIPTARTKAQAEEAERQILAEIHAGTYGKPQSNLLLKEFVERTFVPWSRANKDSWRSDLSRLKPILDFFGKKRLKEICDNPFLVETYKTKRLKMPVIYKSKTGAISSQKERSKTSINRELQLLSRIFTLAMERKEVKENPVSRVDLFPERKRKRRLHLDERARLLAAISSSDGQGKREHLSAIIILDLNTGLRRTELLSLKVADVDFQHNTIRATETKNGEEREVIMNATARGLLLDLAGTAQARGWEYIFTNPRTRTRYKDVKKAFKNACRDAGIEDLRLHDLRHEFASTAGDDPQVSMAALAETMGHKDWKTTMQYTHASRASKLKVVNAQERRETENGGHKTVTNEKRQAS